MSVHAPPDGSGDIGNPEPPDGISPAQASRALPGVTPGRRPTRYFTNVLGVFQGGGVRGAALAGAYAAARARGVRFGAVAGTSAGAIVAAFIAAGATPEFLHETLTETEFKDLLAAPKKA